MLLQELAILGAQESVELLAAVAEIDAEQTPPCCLEIAQLCGRLPVSNRFLLFAIHATDDVCIVSSA